LSEIVGEIEDEEYDEEEDEDEEDIVKISDSEWEMDGLTPLDEVSEAVGISLPEDEFDTLSGLILDCIDYVPDDGATIDVETNGLKIKATEIKDRRVVRAIVKKL
jgi:putative hemolysin